LLSKINDYSVPFMLKQKLLYQAKLLEEFLTCGRTLTLKTSYQFVLPH
jgi:hypothetical protein